MGIKLPPLAHLREFRLLDVAELARSHDNRVGWSRVAKALEHGVRHAKSDHRSETQGGEHPFLVLPKYAKRASHGLPSLSGGFGSTDKPIRVSSRDSLFPSQRFETVRIPGF